MNKFSRLYHTVRFLKPRQVFAQVQNRLRSKFENHKRFLAKPVSDFDRCLWPEDIEILPPGMQVNSAKSILDGSFTFLNNTQNIGWMPDWDCPNLPKLWQYNLHYFEWLWALDYQDAKAAVIDWIESHRLSKCRVGWEPYPISLRVMNICGVFFGKFRSRTLKDESFAEQFWQSIYHQCQWLMSHLEVHLLGNHYFENAAALAFVGSCFQGQAAQRWLDLGLEILKKEIPEQILPDGMHFELSPMYHSRMLYLMAILRSTDNQTIIDLVDEPMARMIQAMDTLYHPDGQIALLNDSALGIYNQPTQLLDYCSKVSWTRGNCHSFEPLPLLKCRSDQRERDIQSPLSNTSRAASSQQNNIQTGAFSLPDAGYYGWHDQQDNYLVCDAGKIGPDYIPGHAHADIFSFELSLKGHRVIADAGVYDYVDSDMRRYCRATAAHNTVEVDGNDQCQMWSSFRVAKRVYPEIINYSHDENGFELFGRYDGIKKQKNAASHLRKFLWQKQGYMTVEDKIMSSKNVSAKSRLHLHPDCRIQDVRKGFIKVAYPAGVFAIEFPDEIKVNIEKSYYLPEFGMKLKNDCIVFSGSGTRIELQFKIITL